MPEPSSAELLADGRRQRSEERLDAAASSFRRALDRAWADGDPLAVVDALKGLGQIARDREAWAEAIGHYGEAVALCRQHAGASVLAHTVRHLGDVHRRGGDLTVAAACYEEALAIYRAAAPPPALDLANTLRPFALLAQLQGDRPAAIERWRAAEALYDSAGIAAGVDECREALAALDA